LETANKRGLRTHAAIYQYYATLVGYDVSRLVVLNRLVRAFIKVASAQELLKVAREQVEVAKESLRIATKKVEAGKVSLIQQSKAEVAYSSALVDLETAEVNLKNDKRRLSLQWANPMPDFEEVLFSFYDISVPENFENYLSHLCNQAEVVQSLYNTLDAEATWKLEKANRIPNVNVQVGYKANYEEDNQGMALLVTVPLPFFNRNQGNIGRAYYDMLKTGEQGKQLWLILESKLAISYEEWMLAYQQASKIKSLSLPQATQSLYLAQRGYQEGKLAYLDVLDAQRTLFDIKASYIQALMNYHSKQADIDYLNSQME